MIHAYNEEFLTIIQTKLASVIELGVLTEKIEIDQFMELFLSSPRVPAIGNRQSYFCARKVRKRIACRYPEQRAYGNRRK